MQKALASNESVIDIHHAGTAMRFLTAYLSVQEDKEVVITGSSRMKERPIKILVEALLKLGAHITYLENDGFPPLKIVGKKLTKHKVALDANVSSQYISALLLIASKLDNGLELTLNGKITSVPYIKMTLSLLNEIGIETRLNARIKSPVDGVVSGVEDTPIFSILNTLFTTVFGRRLGTTTDGTTLRANPELGVDPDFTDSTITPLDKNTRDLTLNQVITIKVPSIAKITVRGDELKYGYAYCGPRMKNINTYWRFLSGGDNPQTSTVGATLDSTVSTNISPMQMANWANFRLTGLNSTDYDGELVQFRDINTPDLKTNLAFPTEIKVS